MHPLLILLAGMVVVVGGILVLRLHAFLALLLGALTVGLLTSSAAVERYALERGLSAEQAAQLAAAPVGQRVAEGFGGTVGDIGIIIAMASLIGICMLESGAADRLVRSGLRLVGSERAPLALTGTSFLLSVPVFFDTVFYLMVPLAKATRFRTGRNYLFYVLAIVAGGSVAHSLVPPTPGPLFVAGELGVDIGLMILVGAAIGIVASTAGYLFSSWLNRRMELPLRESPEAMKDLERIAHTDEKQLPPAWLSILPILLPVVLIAGRTVAESFGHLQGGLLVSALSLFGEKNLALILAGAVAVSLLVWKRPASEAVSALKSSLSTAGVIILIVGGGGAFGHVLQQTGIGTAIRAITEDHNVPVLLLAFLLTTLIRTAQGSATVAMITAAGTLMGMADAAQLGFHPVYLAVAIGCGSKPVMWMNDAGFWIITEMSGLTVREGLGSITLLTALMGVVGLVTTMMAAYLFPLV